MHADQAVLAAVHALAQSPLRPGVLDDVTDVAQLRKQVSPVAPSFFRARASQSRFSPLDLPPPRSARDRRLDPRPHRSLPRDHPDSARPPTRVAPRERTRPRRSRPVIARDPPRPLSRPRERDGPHNLYLYATLDPPPPPPHPNLPTFTPTQTPQLETHFDVNLTEPEAAHAGMARALEEELRQLDGELELEQHATRLVRGGDVAPSPGGNPNDARGANGRRSLRGAAARGRRAPRASAPSPRRLPRSR